MKILIVTKNWLGDLLFQFPAIEAIKRCWPEAEIMGLTPARCVPMLEAHPDVDRVLTFDEREDQKGLGARLGFILKLRKEKWDRAYLFHGSRTRAMMVWLAGASERVGYGKDRRWFLTRSPSEPRQPVHHVDYFLALLEKTGHEIKGDRRYRFYFSEAARNEAEVFLSRMNLKKGQYVCFHVGANWEPKRWPVQHFARTADGISKKWGLPVVITGGPGDIPLSEAVKSEAERAAVISVAGKTGLGVLGALFRQSCFVLSGDSGPMHIASGSGARVLALFGPTDPALTGPRGVGESVIMRYVPEGYQVPWYGSDMPPEGWMSQIRPQDVIQKIEEQHWMERT